MAHVKVGSESPVKTVLVGATSTDTFTFTFAYLSAADVKVYNGAALVSSSLYTLTGNAVDRGFEGGTIVLTTAVTNTTIKIERVTDRARETDFSTSAEFDIDGLNTEFDGFRMIAQELDVKISDLETATGTLPTPIFLTPYYFGATAGQETTVDNSTYVQQCFDAMAGSWTVVDTADGLNGYFAILVDLSEKVWRCDSDIKCVNVGQPGMFAKNGTIWSRSSGGIGLDLGGLNNFTAWRLRVYGDKTTPPNVGFAVYRTKERNLGISPEHAFISCSTSGYFAQAAYYNGASEVDKLIDCKFYNRHRSTTAVVIACVDNHQSTIDLWGGSGFVSANASPAEVADGRKSNVLHAWGAVHAKRPADVTLVIDSVTKANPAVVTVSAGTLAGAGLSNGDEVFIQQSVGMTELNGQSYTVANINTGADTFELSGVDSSAYGTFTSGSLTNRNGPPFFLAGSDEVNLEGAYLLCYGSPMFLIDQDNSTLRQFNAVIQGERHPEALVEFWQDASTNSVIQAFRIVDLSKDQDYGDAIFKNANTGSVIRFDGLEVRITNEGATPPNLLFKYPAYISIKAGQIEVPLAAALNPKTAYSNETYHVLELAFDRGNVAHDYRPTVFGNSPVFQRLDAGSLVAKFYSDDSGATAEPLVDFERESTTPAASDSLAQIRFVGQNDAAEQVVYGAIQGVLGDPADGAEDGRVNLNAMTNGTLATQMFFSHEGAFVMDSRIQAAVQATTAELADIGDAINTADKFTGKQVWNTTTGRPVWAAGNTAGAVWVDHAGSTLHTPV